MTAHSHDVFDADQPIPLGRPTAPIPAATSPEAPSEAQPVIELQPVVAVPDAEPPLTPIPAAVVAKPEVVPATASTTPVPAARPAPPPVISRPPTDRPAQPGAHPMADLRGFRLEPIRVERPDGGRRDLVRFLVQFALVMAFVYALIVAFVLLVAHVRGTPA